MTDELKELLISAKSKEEALEIISSHRDALSDAELEKIVGGELLWSTTCERNF